MSKYTNGGQVPKCTRCGWEVCKCGESSEDILRESPLPTEDEIKEVLGVNYLDDDDIELFRIATTKALRWVVEDLKNRLMGWKSEEAYDAIIQIADEYEAKLKEVD